MTQIEQASKPFADILIHYFNLCYENTTGKPLSDSMKEELEMNVLCFAKAIVREAKELQGNEPQSLPEQDRRQALKYGLRHGNQAF